jgi:hypothetical protein
VASAFPDARANVRRGAPKGIAPGRIRVHAKAAFPLRAQTTPHWLRAQDCRCVSDRLLFLALEALGMDQFSVARARSIIARNCDQITMRPKNELAAPAADITQMVLRGPQ